MYCIASVGTAMTSAPPRAFEVSMPCCTPPYTRPNVVISMTDSAIDTMIDAV